MRVLAGFLAAAFILWGLPVLAADRTQTVDGQFALPDKTAEVGGTLTATPVGGNVEALDIVLNKMGETAPLTAYDTELTKAMHVIAVSGDFKTFLHDHVAKAAADGHCRLTMKFPHAGLYHIYADASPTGIGQQVMRFDVTVGAPAKEAEPDLTPTGDQASDGAYSVKFDSLDMVAGNASMLTLHILKNGQPAPDIKPFLGVAAHAVLIDTQTYIYVHSHPMAMSPAIALNAGAVSPDLMLHMAPPAAGIYKLWIQFNGGGKLRTVPFVLEVKSS